MGQEDRGPGGDSRPGRASHGYVRVYSFMGSALRLSGLELLVFARIFGFTVSGLPFFESRAKTAEFFGSSRRAVITAVGKLADKGLIKEIRHEDGAFSGKSKAYAADLKRVSEAAGIDIDAFLTTADEAHGEERSPCDMPDGEAPSPSTGDGTSRDWVKKPHPIPKGKDYWR